MTDQPTPPGSTPTPTHPPSPAKQAAPATKVAPVKKAAPATKVAPVKKAAPGKHTAPVAKREARTGKPSTETNKDRAIHLDIGPVEIDIPRTLGYYGGIGAAVAFGVLEPPIAVFIAALPVIKMLGTRVANTSAIFRPDTARRRETGRRRRLGHHPVERSRPGTPRH